MSSLKARVERLEADLKMTPMRHYVYSDLPFAIFCYAPREEWQMRREIALLKTRLEHDTHRQVATISLAELMWQSIQESEGIAALSALERQYGFADAERQIQDYLSQPEWRPLCELLAERLNQLEPDRHIAFVMRAAALAPNLYRVPKLLDEMKSRTRVPCVLFMPATTEGDTNLRFMGIAQDEGRGSFHTKVYA